MTIGESARAIFPSASIEERWNVLWEETSYPWGGRVLVHLELLRARAAREQAARSRK